VRRTDRRLATIAGRNPADEDAPGRLNRADAIGAFSEVRFVVLGGRLVEVGGVCRLVG